MKLRLVSDKPVAPVAGCQRVPVLWSDGDGWTHAGAVLGVKWRCETCGIESQGVFGNARDLPEIAADALAVFMNGPAAGKCVYFGPPVELAAWR
ncbi:hypothetical protein [Shimia thalassica]|uniref:hypothetical protein n=1 Tax=Shimia thalassica TaxID=1715693 RepID=UPI0026E3B4FA|nr:hypothetical protein [Shimia thalassica]MDO6479119.1 hypothetical protein [Shimia thalassica]